MWPPETDETQENVAMTHEELNRWRRITHEAAAHDPYYDPDLYDTNPYM